MTAHPNVTAVDEMTKAIFGRDRERLTELFCEDMVLHARGALPIAGDHVGMDAFLAAFGRLFELSEGNIRLEQLFCLGAGEWASEWERAEITIDGRTFETNNAFVYRFSGDRIAEMWFLSAAPAEHAAFWS